MVTLIIDGFEELEGYPYHIIPGIRVVHPSGCFLVTETMRGLPMHKVSRIIIVARREDRITDQMEEDMSNEIYQNYSIEPEYFHAGKYNHSIFSKLKTCIDKFKITGPIFFKGFLNCYNIDDFPEVSTIVATRFIDLKNLRLNNKVFINTENEENNCSANKIIGDMFFSGMYIEDTALHIKNYQTISIEKKRNTNEVYSAVCKNVPIMETKNYIDLSTLELWELFRSFYSTIFVDLDGVLIRYVGKTTRNVELEQTTPIRPNIFCLNNLYRSGKHHIIITTFRPDNDNTHKILREYGILYHRLIGDLPENHKEIISSFDFLHKYPYSSAVNLPKNSETLKWRFSDGTRHWAYQ